MGDRCSLSPEEGRGCGLAQGIRALATIANAMIKQSAKDADDSETAYELQHLPTQWPTTPENGEAPPCVNVGGEWDKKAGRKECSRETGPTAEERETGGSVEMKNDTRKGQENLDAGRVTSGIRLALIQVLLGKLLAIEEQKMAELRRLNATFQKVGQLRHAADGGVSDVSH